MKYKLKIILLLILLLYFFSFATLSFADTTVHTDSQAALLIEVSTGKILYEKNSTKRMYPASTTKIMTAILVLENCNLSDTVTVSSTALENIPNGYVTCQLQVGEELTVENLLYALMVLSANDAAYVLAEHVGGTIEHFSDMMNAKAEALGCTDTHFINPNGIHSANHYSTAYDLYLMANYAMKNETFQKLVTTTAYTLPATNKYPSADRSLLTTNELINPHSTKYYYKYAIGIKTGYTSEAGNCLVSMSSRDGLSFISVVLGGGTTSTGLNARYTDTIKLFDYAYDNFTLNKLIEQNSIVKTIEIKNATKETKTLNLVAADTITVINHKETDIQHLLPDIHIDESILAPIHIGDVIGTIKYTVDDVEYSSYLLASTEVIPQNNIGIYVSLVGIIILFIGSFLYSKNRKKSKRNKKYRYKNKR